jgi:hypothetical protein
MRNGIQTGEGDSKNGKQVVECEKVRWKGDLERGSSIGLLSDAAGHYTVNTESCQHVQFCRISRATSLTSLN